MNTLLEVRDLSVEYPGRGWRSSPTQILKGVSLDVAAGETVGLVGESGSGKSTLGRAILGLAPVKSGSIVLEGHELVGLSPRRRREICRDLQVVFQDPYSSLNPSMTIGEILSEPLTAAGVAGRAARQRVAEMLDRVRMPGDTVDRLPQEFSGGQRQRIAIARSLALRPKLIICDEPVSALDLTTQATVLDLFIDLQEQTGVAYLFISHDLTVVRHISHRVLVLRGGEVIESGDGDTMTSNPSHPYTQALLLSAPVADPVGQRLRREARKKVVDQSAG